MVKSKVPISQRALFQRLTRKLAQQDEKLCTARSPTMEQECGRHYVVNVRRNAVIRKDVDIVSLGRELEALKPWEELVAE